MGCVAACNADRPESLKTLPRSQEINNISNLSESRYMSKSSVAINTVHKSQKDRKSQAQLSLKIKLFTSKEINVQVKESCSIKELKTIIYEQHCRELEPEQTVLTFNQTVLDLKNSIKSLNLKEQAVIFQRKAQVWQISSLIADKHKQDPISCGFGVAKMSCGHQFGRETMVAWIKSQVNSRQLAIRCPFRYQQGQLCNCEWDRKQWKLVAGFSQSEMRTIEYNLSQNLIDLYIWQ